MPDIQSILENFRYQVIEIESQVKLAANLLRSGDARLLDKINSKDDYIDNLKTNIENICFSYINQIHDETEISRVRAIHVICVNLERIGDFCVNIARQTRYLTGIDFIQRFDHAGMFDLILKSLGLVIPAFQNRDLSVALEICHSELHLDSMYKDNFDQIMSSMHDFDKNVILSVLGEIAPYFRKYNTVQAFELFKTELGNNTLYKAVFDRVLGQVHKQYTIADHITAIFIFRYLERIGDSLLNIGEALIFSIIGDKIKIRQFRALERTLTDSGFGGTLRDIDFRAILGSRSGCQIGRINAGQVGQPGYKAQGIFKTGAVLKIRKEKENTENWECLYPGLVPKVYAYYERDGNASMLVEFLPGCTLDEVVLGGDREMIKNASFILENLLSSIWLETKTTTPVPSDYMAQLESRLDSVIKVHPGFLRGPQKIETFEIASTHELMDICKGIEKKLSAPFSVLLHGDFNTNNVVYDHADQKLHFIDLFRSRTGDYIQDASVFLVSFFRLPFFKKDQRSLLNIVIEHFYEFFKKFAVENNDATFEIRMALGLARSFYTSTRFEMNVTFAKHMCMRTHYLMEKMRDHGERPLEDFRLPEEVLYY